jgi:oligosaccharide repeat unit polymerase
MNLVLAIINMLSITFITGERTHFFALFIFFVAAYFMSIKKENKGQPKRKRNIRIIVASSIVVFIIVTMGRGISGDNLVVNLFKTIFLYFSGGIHIFSNVLSNQVEFGLENLTYGLASFSGFVSLFTTFTYVFLGIPSDGPFNTSIIQSYLSGNIQIGESTYMNAFPTMFYYFIRDFGFFGLFFMSLFFSSIILLIFKSHRRNNFLASIVYIYICYLLIMTVCWWEPQRTEFWSSLFHLLWLSQIFLARKIFIRKRGY